MSGNQIFCMSLCGLVVTLLLGLAIAAALSDAAVARAKAKLPPPRGEDVDARHRQDVIDAHFAGVPREERDQ